MRPSAAIGAAGSALLDDHVHQADRLGLFDDHLLLTSFAFVCG
jgi:hypothetical protein